MGSEAGFEILGLADVETALRIPKDVNREHPQNDMAVNPSAEGPALPTELPGNAMPFYTSSWLPGQDSNLDAKLQRLLCYRYTTRQSSVAKPFDYRTRRLRPPSSNSTSTAPSSSMTPALVCCVTSPATPGYPTSRPASTLWGVTPRRRIGSTRYSAAAPSSTPRAPSASPTCVPTSSPAPASPSS